MRNTRLSQRVIWIQYTLLLSSSLHSSHTLTSSPVVDLISIFPAAQAAQEVDEEALYFPLSQIWQAEDSVPVSAFTRAWSEREGWIGVGVRVWEF